MKLSEDVLILWHILGITIYMVWVTFLHIIFFSTLVIKYVSLSDLQALFYRQVLFVEKKFHCELVVILLYEKSFKNNVYICFSVLKIDVN